MVDSRIHSGAVATPSPLVAPPAALPDRAAAPSVAAHPFAEMLRQNRLAAVTPATSPRVDATKALAGKTLAPASESQSRDAPPDATSAQRAPASTRTRSADAGHAAASDTENDVAAANEAPVAASETPHADGDDGKNAAAASGDPALTAANLANAQAAAAQGADLRATDVRSRAAAASDELASRGNATSAPSTTTTLPFGASTTSGAIGERRVGLSAGDDLRASAGDDSEASADAAATGSFASLIAETKNAPTPGATADGTTGATLAPATPPTGFAPHAPASAAGTASTSVAVPVHSPEFAAAFGMQVSVLAKDGVQHAELHLNPADMGPVSVSITLDGTQARVDFGADVAATRHAIESGLPELASALRDAGFTLAGGGVAQHSGSGSGNGDRDGSFGRGGSSPVPQATVASLDGAARRLNRAVAAGGVDVYA